MILFRLFKSNKIILFTTMLIAFTACILRIDHYFLGFDERATVSCAYGFHFGYEKDIKYFTKEYFDNFYTIKGVIQSTAADNGNAFAYNTLLHFWTMLTGFNMFGLHLLSILFFIFSIPFFLGILTKSIDDKFILHLSLFIYCCHPFFIFMARQIRGYSLSLFLAVAATYFLMIFIEKKEKTGLAIIGYTICISLLPLTHYMFGSLLLAHFIFVLVKYKNKQCEVFPVYVMIASSIICGICLLSWLIIAGWEAYSTVLQVQLKSWQDHPADFIHLSLYNFASYLSNLLCFSEGIILQFMGYRLRAYAILVLPFIGLLYLGYSGKNISQKYALLFWLIPVCMLFSDLILSLRSGILISYYPKYNIIIIPFLIIVTACGIGHLRKKSSYIIPVFITVLFITFFWSYTEVIYKDHSHVFGTKNIFSRNNSPYKEIAKRSKLLFQKGDTLVFPSWEHAAFSNYAMPGNKFVQSIDTTNNNTFVYLKNGPAKQNIFDFSKDPSHYNYGWN
jgi:hypothetical protein